jgi:hypothetical protein
MRGRGMVAGYSQGLCFILGVKVGPVQVIETFIRENLQTLLDQEGEGDEYKTRKVHEHN